MNSDQTLRRNLRNYLDHAEPGQLAVLLAELAEHFMRKHYDGALELSRISTELELLQAARDVVRRAAEDFPAFERRPPWTVTAPE